MVVVAANDFFFHASGGEGLSVKYKLRTENVTYIEYLCFEEEEDFLISVFLKSVGLSKKLAMTIVERNRSKEVILSAIHDLFSFYLNIFIYLFSISFYYIYCCYSLLSIHTFLLIIIMMRPTRQ